MKHGVNIPPFADAATVVGWTREAEAAGWDGVFLWDHIQWNPGVAPLDPWVLLGAMAQATERVRLGTLVTPLSRRRPQVVAKHLTTLDHLSGGRAVLGVGLGDPVDRDFADLGEETDAKVRAAMLDESLAVLDQNKRPLARARRWDGAVPIGVPDDVTPEELAAHLTADGEPPREGWDVVVTIHREDVPVQEYADAGATWIIHSAQPITDDWQDTISRVVRSGPHTA